MEALAKILSEYWGYDSFRPLQEEAMRSAMGKRDSLVVLPTGGGKSICYQAPALAMDGMAVVVSPLISLMKDQVDALNDSGVAAACINSSMTEDERRSVHDGVRHGRIKLLYVAPERLGTERFIEYLKERPISFFAVDEAHCISHWGHDFRPEYRKLGMLRDTFPDVALHAFTATATEHVRKDICEELRLREPDVLVGSFFRPNLTYSAQRCAGDTKRTEELCERVLARPNEAGIVYCISRKQVDNTSRELRKRGVKALPYHAGMGDDARKANQEAFANERADVIVATVAFGMGIDKSNVRYVIHSGMPKSIEHYQQESGRAGRDGLPSECVLLYGANDFTLWKRILGDSPDDAQAIALQKLAQMWDYCTGMTCRHRALLAYFGEALEKRNCEACDVCLGQLDLMENASSIAKRILGSIRDLGERYWAAYVTDVLSGSCTDKVAAQGHSKHPVMGALSEFEKSQVRDWIEQLAAQGALVRKGEYNLLTLSDIGKEMLDGDRTPTLLKPAKKEKTRKKRTPVRSEDWADVDEGLFEALRKLRREISSEKGVPPYVVFSDATLRDLARVRPVTKEYFLACRGVGRHKNNEYGAVFRTAIREYCEDHSLDTDVSAPADTASPFPAGERPKRGGVGAKETAFELFREGAEVEQVARETERAVTTVRGYLTDYIRDENVVDPTPWVSGSDLERIREAAEHCGTDRARPVFEYLQEEVGYPEIQVALACLRNQESPARQ